RCRCTARSGALASAGPRHRRVCARSRAHAGRWIPPSLAVCLIGMSEHSRKGGAGNPPDGGRLFARERSRGQNPLMATTENQRDTGSGTEKWRQELYEAAAERQGELFTTISGLEHEPLYNPEPIDV